MKWRWIEVIINLFFWGVTSWMIISSFSITGMEIESINGDEQMRVIRNTDLVKQLSWIVGFSFILFHLNYWILVHHRVMEKILVGTRTSILILAGFIVIFLITRFLMPAMVRHLVPTGLALGIILFFYLASSVYGVGKRLIQAEKKRQQLELEKKQTELQLLRSQLQPHFLFNVLNNLLSMVDQVKNPLLADSIDRLSGLLRYVVDETSKPSVTLMEEIGFIRNYAELHLLRFEENEVDFSLNVTGSNQQQWVEPGIFLPFVENAFRYGVAPEVVSFIHISFDVTEPSKIIFQIQNPILNPEQTNRHGGTGIKAARERLAFTYPQRHHLAIEKNDIFTVTLELVQDADDHR